MTRGHVPVIAIDGPGGSGKGTVALALAARLGWHFLDSGSLYRKVALAAMDQGIDPGDAGQLGRLVASLDVGADPAAAEATDRADGRLRSEAVSAFASKVAALPEVRQGLIERQRAFRRPPGLVADGRDMGTVVFPDADLKVFLTASVEERAQRRYKQLKEKGESVNLSRLFREIEERDERDRTRALAPLRPAPDAHLVDSTGLSVEQVLARVNELLGQAGLK